MHHRSYPKLCEVRPAASNALPSARRSLRSPSPYAPPRSTLAVCKTLQYVHSPDTHCRECLSASAPGVPALSLCPVIQGLARSETSPLHRDKGTSHRKSGAYRDRRFQNPAGEEGHILPTEMPRGSSGPFDGASGDWAGAPWSVCLSRRCYCELRVLDDGRGRFKAVDRMGVPACFRPVREGAAGAGRPLCQASSQRWP
jgi:hypothetical protein